MMKRNNQKLAMALTAALVSGAALTGCVVAQSPSAEANSGSAAFGAINADGIGTVQAVPDIATLHISVSTVGETGEDAKTVKDRNTEQYNQAVEFLKAQGISEDSICTENVWLNPNYDWSNGKQELTGYTMETDLSVSDIPIENVGALMDSAVDQGINGIQSVEYSSSEYDAKYHEALAKAVENAKGKASAIADATGLTLGDAVSVTEYGADTSARYDGNGSRQLSYASAEQASASMDVMPGTLEISANVNVSFAAE